MSHRVAKLILVFVHFEHHGRVLFRSCGRGHGRRRDEAALVVRSWRASDQVTLSLLVVKQFAVLELDVVEEVFAGILERTSQLADRRGPDIFEVLKQVAFESTITLEEALKSSC